MDIVFRVFNDGFAFRYEFPDSSEELHHISKELTTFSFDSEARAWLQPLAEVNTGWAETNPSYEEHYLQDIPLSQACPTKAGWALPALVHSAGKWIAITETGLNENYCGARLKNLADGSGYQIAFPMEKESMEGGALYPESTLPWTSPWRVIALGSLESLVESTLGTDLADASRIDDISWISPGRASWSWALLKDNSVNFETQMRFIDYAADMSWEYCLVDVNWDRQIGYDRIQELADHAKKKNVGLILWYNSSGDWNLTEYSPKSALVDREDRRKEFARISEMGIKGVKVDFFGGDGQSMINYYHELFSDAADFNLLVNCHGTTLPRGWQRTYPNVLTMESIKGFEFATFAQEDTDLVPTMSCMIPFTRNLFDPMDFTPVVFGEIPGRNRLTTNCAEMAQSLIYLSGIQHFAETPEGMAAVSEDVKEFMRNVPVAWDQSEFLGGFPGKDVVLARRSGMTWYVAGINGEDSEKVLSADPEQLGDVKLLKVFTDGENGREVICNKDADPANLEEMKVAPHGGFVALLEVVE